MAYWHSGPWIKGETDSLSSEIPHWHPLYHSKREMIRGKQLSEKPNFCFVGTQHFLKTIILFWGQGFGLSISYDSKNIWHDVLSYPWAALQEGRSAFTSSASETAFKNRWLTWSYYLRSRKYSTGFNTREIWLRSKYNILFIYSFYFILLLSILITVYLQLVISCYTCEFTIPLK